MSVKVLICDQKLATQREFVDLFEGTSYAASAVSSGKEAQLKVSQEKFLALFLNINTKDNFWYEVLSYMKLNAPSVKVYLTHSQPNELDGLDLTEEKIGKLGIVKVVQLPSSKEAIVELLNQSPGSDAWKSISKRNQNQTEEEVSVADTEFSKIPIGEFFSGNVTIFDLFIRLSENKYLKILHQGDGFDPQKLESYKTEKGVEFLYYKASDKITYINFTNEFLGKYLSQKEVDTKKATVMTKGLIENYVAEVHTSGLNPALLEEGKKISENVYKLLMRNRKVALHLNEFKDLYSGSMGHAFLTTIYASVIASNLDWANKMTHQYISQGSLLHDIGKIKISPEVHKSNFDDLSDDLVNEYKTHPVIGYELLVDCGLPEQVRQITYQHHECVNGEGFPNGLFGMRIFPLAKVVSLASDFAKIVTNGDESPIKALKNFVPDRSVIFRYDPSCVKALIKGFIS